MEFRGFLNPHFVSCSNYMKAGIEIWDGGFPIGMFAVLYNPQSQKTQKQSFVYNKRQRNVNANIYGRQRRGVIEFDVFQMDRIKEAKFTAEERNGLSYCVNALGGALTKYAKEDNRIDWTIRQQIKDFINEIKFNFFNPNVGEGEEIKEEKISFSGRWIDHNLDNMNNEDMCNIAKMLSEENNPESGIMYKGNCYRISNSANGGMVLQIYDADGGEEVIEENISNAVVRKMVQMAKMKNADGLTEFINGNFYPIVGFEEFNNITYFTLLADNGEMRKVNKNRIEPLYVYTEPPINEPETAL